ncbi:MAG: tRNA pseudouridine(38-40) synthase TruA [Lachnospiraceae bacterium]|nr:tRNA pseudouridine(38-40) synthase TruA [Lachnospiraceae bacterium]
MGNYRIILQYEGTKYQGWQRQDSTNNTIQGKLEALLTKMCGEPVEIQGSGRTDAGVHAYGQVANFHGNTEYSTEEIMEYMNRYLPEDIGVIQVEQVHERFHSRLNAKGKVYRYRVMTGNVPHIFDRKFVYEHPESLDVAAMKEAAALLIGTHDFKSFTSTKRGKKSTVRTIEAIEIVKNGDEICFTYKGDGFLYHMVRILTGTLIEVGEGKRSCTDITRILEAKEREEAGFLAPAKGLALMEVFY